MIPSEEGSAWRMISLIIDTLLHDWYPTVQAGVRIQCPSCNHPHFTREECCSSMLSSNGILHCGENSVIRVRDIAPDIAMVDLMESFWMRNDELLYKAADMTSGKKFKLGEGAYGVVYAGKLKTKGTRVAVKELHEGVVPGGQEYLDLLNEIWIMRYRTTHFLHQQTYLNSAASLIQMWLDSLE